MGIINEVKRGADLTHPRLSTGWILTAFIAVLILIAVVIAAMWTWGQAKTVVPGLARVTTAARSYMS